jgi:hypothetical protein
MQVSRSKSQPLIIDDFVDLEYDGTGRSESPRSVLLVNIELDSPVDESILTMTARIRMLENILQLQSESNIRKDKEIQEAYKLMESQQLHYTKSSQEAHDLITRLRQTYTTQIQDQAATIEAMKKTIEQLEARDAANVKLLTAMSPRQFRLNTYTSPVVSPSVSPTSQVIGRPACGSNSSGGMPSTPPVSLGSPGVQSSVLDALRKRDLERSQDLPDNVFSTSLSPVERYLINRK